MKMCQATPISIKSDKNTLFSVTKYKVNISVFWEVSSRSLVRGWKYFAEFSRLYLHSSTMNIGAVCSSGTLKTL
jgi:hypothetical protein